ncbi:MAG TPA: shikimate dehydrogenase [Thermoanaerobaculia bacterium]|nr:shikimate dehydrogenase [Thermoanaerobaculia bacterium]
MSETTAGATLVAVLDAHPRSAESLHASTRQAGWLEVRVEADPSWLRAHFQGKLLYAAGGGADRLLAAAREYDFVNLTPEECVPRVLEGIPAAQRVISAPCDAAEAALAIPATLYRFTVHAYRSGDELVPLRLLRKLGRRDVTAYATGPIGTWSRIVAPWLGAPFVFENAGEIERLSSSFGFPELPPIEELFGMVGNPVLHSYSPRIHNTAFRAQGRKALYVPFHVENFDDFRRNILESREIEALGLTLNALSIVSPYKAVALDAAAGKSPMVAHAGSTNFFRRDDDGEWIAHTTDADGVLLTLRERGVQCRNKSVAVIGCGGSGRAMAAALHQAGADVTLVNRGLERGNFARDLLGLPFLPLRHFSGEAFSIVVNATPVGRDSDDIAFPVDSLKRDAVIVDLVYRDSPTQLMSRTRGPGRITVDGWDMLVTQALRQFRLMTGSDMPERLARQALGFDEPAAVAVDV